jgi:hypothetical protein
MARRKPACILMMLAIVLASCEIAGYPYFTRKGEYPKAAFYSANDYLCGLNGDGSMSAASWELMVNVAVYAAKGGASVTMGLMDHQGDWSPDPSALLNLKGFIEANTPLKASVVDVVLGQIDISGVDLLFVTGHSFGLSDEQKACFREFFAEYNGVMFADDCNGGESEAFTGCFKSAVAELTGTTEYETVAPDHQLYSCYYQLDGSNWANEEDGLYGWVNGAPLQYFDLR